MILNIEPLLYGQKKKKRRRWREPEYDREPSPVESLFEAWTLDQLKKAIDKAEKSEQKKDEPPKKKKWFELDAQNLAAIIFLSTFLMVPVQMWMILSVLKEIVRVYPR